MTKQRQEEMKKNRRAAIVSEVHNNAMFFVRKNLEKALLDLANMKLSAADEAFVVNLTCKTLRDAGVKNSALQIIAERILANTSLEDTKDAPDEYGDGSPA